jgi:hypothetical protein
MFIKILRILLICFICSGGAGEAASTTELESWSKDYLSLLRKETYCPEWVMTGGMLGDGSLAEPSIYTLFEVTNEILLHKDLGEFLEKHIEKIRDKIKEITVSKPEHLNYLLFYKAFSDFILLKYEGTFENYITTSNFRTKYTVEFKDIFTSENFDKRYVDIRRYTRGVKLGDYINSVWTMIAPPKAFEEKHPDVIFAGYPELEKEYKCYKIGGGVEISPYYINPFQRMRVLVYDLNIAENQCNWRAKGLLAQEILDTIGGKYGQINLSDEDSIKEMRMAALHASMALYTIKIQRKTTELCKKHVGITEEKLKELYPQIIRSSEDLKLDEPLKRYIETVDPNKPETNSDELLIKKPRFAYTENNLEEIYELGVLLSNPNVAKEVCYRAWYEHLIAVLNNRSQPDSYQLYMQHAKKFIGETFNFEGEEYLKQLVMEYFVKLYKKAEQLFRYPKESICLKLRDCGARDIFGNTNVCSYNVLLELIRRNPDNAEFVSAGGMYDAQEIIELAKADLADGLFKIYTQDGTEISNLGTIFDEAIHIRCTEYSKTREEIIHFINYQTKQLEFRTFDFTYRFSTPLEFDKKNINSF